jgi:RimJ/RimL family protein N-acetyltransferase
MTPHLTGTPVLETERLTLRAPGPQDWEAFCAFVLSDRASFIRPPDQDLDRRKAWRAFGHVIGHWALRGFGQLVFCPKGGDTALGMTGPWFPEGWPGHELGWTVWTPEAEGQGFAAEAAAIARDHAFNDLGWDTAVSYIDPGNTRSIRLAERLGAVPDRGAAVPNPAEPVLVYRHPRPTGPAA